MDLNKDISDIDVKKFNVKNLDFGGLKDFFLNFLIPLVSLVGTGALVLFVFLPSYRELPTLKSRLSTKSALATRLKEKVSVLNLLVDLKSQVEEDSERVDKTLVSDVKVPELLAQIDKMSKESSMTVSSLGYSRGRSGSSQDEEVDYSNINVSLSVDATQDNLLTFLRKAENASRLVLIEDLRYSQGSKGEGEKPYGVTFQLSSPYLKLELDAVTDESIQLDISDPKFKKVLAKLEDLNYYEIDPEDYITDIEESTPSAEGEGEGDNQPPPEEAPAPPESENLPF